MLEKGEFQLLVAGADGQGERVLTSGRTPLANGKGGPALFGPAWSPDGTFIAFATYPVGSQVHSELRTISVKDGSTRLLYSTADELGRPLWLPDFSGIVVPIAEYSRHLRGQIWYIPYPSGQPRRITDDLNDYDIWNLDVSRDGYVIADRVKRVSADVWVAPSQNPSNAEAITSSGFAEEIGRAHV